MPAYACRRGQGNGGRFRVRRRMSSLVTAVAGLNKIMVVVLTVTPMRGQ
ncbi:hypothetical protein [Streptomyces bluensis]